MIFLIPCGAVIRFVVYFCLGIWALMHACLLAESQLLINPDTIGLSSMVPAIQYINLSRVEMALLKNKIEIVLAFLSIPLVVTSQVALIFPVIFIQYIRVKYVSNFFQKHLFKELNKWAKANVPEAIFEFILVQWFRKYLENFGKIGNEEELEAEKQKKKEEKESFRKSEDEKQGNQGAQDASA